MNDDVQTRTTSIPFDQTKRPLGVLVGFDGSAHSILALHYAARAAQRHDASLTVVNAYTAPSDFYTIQSAIPDLSLDSLLLQGAEESLSKAREYLSDYPGEVTYRTEKGDAAGALVDLSGSAQLAVVGSRGRGGFLGRILGSVASALPAHARCPTVVVPSTYDPEATSSGARFNPTDDDRPVIVGVDGSAHSRVAALHAAEAAASRGTWLQLIMAAPPVDDALAWYPELAVREKSLIKERVEELKAQLEIEAAWVAGHVPGLEVKVTVEGGSAVEVLIAASVKAQLTVVGTRGRGGLMGTLVGSTSRGLLLGAQGPVMVVPRLEDDRLADQPTSSRKSR